jgi:hypothetical protein
MGLFNHPVVRGGLFIGGLLVWVVCMLALGALAVTWHEVASEPAHENTMAGIVWLIFGPGLPIGIGVASALLYTGWDTFTAVSRRFALVTAGTVPGIGICFLLGLILTPALASPLVMDGGLILHVGAFGGLHLRTFLAGAVPWTDASPTATSAEKREGIPAPTRRTIFLVVGLVWAGLLVGTTLHCIGTIARGVLPVESAASLKEYGMIYGWCGPLLALGSYVLVELSADALQRASKLWARLARGSSIALFLVTGLVVVALGEVGLPAALAESAIFLLHLGAMGTAFVVAGQQVGMPWATAEDPG